MKNKILLISAVGLMTIISAPASSQNSAPVNNTSSTIKQPIHRIKPVLSTKETTPTKVPVTPVKSAAQPIHLHIQPVSSVKQASANQPAATHSTPPASAVKPIHAHVKPPVDQNKPANNF